MSARCCVHRCCVADDTFRTGAFSLIVLARPRLQVIAFHAFNVENSSSLTFVFQAGTHDYDLGTLPNTVATLSFAVRTASAPLAARLPSPSPPLPLASDPLLRTAPGVITRRAAAVSFALALFCHQRHHAPPRKQRGSDPTLLPVPAARGFAAVHVESAGHA